ncbi:flagellar hook protein FlgE [Agrobacterium rubi]|uniref:Flagellar hook protein FlgE n=1 Tax=Agrobacterium rubi TR3 = NBRC 13261 TaxID=1368415 RepID=A0A081CU84_9HYPH|nr:flagellar hook protein FlgE [Agrobacterium rubi]MBP1879082.1 flagellar hook protein FlgE [Agrobacterium rubi]MCL6652402.1 flagellar biosynthesis protein FlgE [Agrobacterium rubi]NTE85398.1 flagellar hook protein FlgE [Agrobacterium rubi]NTF01330.1 flagellar hook protein FlgE [Agrobacterium rubi]GAK70230.1 flagellar hook protein FlgE [Agrobacterium rubi TR3 = NBRC 13261]
MSLFGTMKTAVSGMGAQANKLGTVGDNIANASTTGYKSASTAFSSLVLNSGGGGSGNYNSGGVETTTKYSISQAGATVATQSATDLAINGDGFFVVQDPSGNIFLTRAGSFTQDDNGNLVNDAGFTLLGYQNNGTTPTTVVNSYDGLVPVNVSAKGLTATASTAGSLTGNLNYSAEVADQSPSDPNATIDLTQSGILKTSMTGYNAYGETVKYDFYFAKTDENEWEVTVYDASKSTNGGFPYSEGPVVDATTMNYDGGTLTDPKTIEIVDPDNDLNITIDLSGMTQLSGKSTGDGGDINGNPAEAVKSISIDSDGTVYATYATSSARALYQIPLADVASPDKLSVLSGNVYQTSADSGVVTLGFAGSSGFGDINSKQLESSNVDIATELTEMIQAQRSYTANSKVFQTGSDLMETLINLVR